MRKTLLLSLLCAAGPSFAQDWGPGENIEEALAIQVTRAGFGNAADLAAVLIPGQLPLPELELAQDCGWFDCYALEFKDAWVGIEIADAELVPGNGILNLDMDLLVQINDTSDRFDLYLEVFGIGDTCSGWVEPFPVRATTSIAMQVITNTDGTKSIDAVVGAIAVEQELSSDDITLKDCAIGTLEEVLNVFGLSLYDLILGQLDGVLDDAISDAAPSLEAALEDAFGAASISQTVPVGDTELQLDLQPNNVTITPDGMQIQMAGSSNAEPADCILGLDPGGSLKTATAIPDINSAGGDAAILLSDDFMNQALYGVWRGGALCYSLDDSASLPLNTAVLGLLAGDAFDEFFPTPKPIIISTSPNYPPVVRFDAENDITIDIPALGLNIYAEVDGRWARLVGMELDAVIGLDMTFDETTGEVNLLLSFDPEAIAVSVAYNELAPDANETIVEKFGTVFGSLVEPLLGGLLGETLSFSLGGIEGIGLTALETSPAGGGDWLEVATGIGPVTYGGCGGETGGCGGETGGEEALECSSSPGQSRSMWLFSLALLVAFRRNRIGR